MSLFFQRIGYHISGGGIESNLSGDVESGIIDFDGGVGSDGFGS